LTESKEMSSIGETDTERMAGDKKVTESKKPTPKDWPGA
jgi:hypothetical protein